MASRIASRLYLTRLATAEDVTQFGRARNHPRHFGHRECTIFPIYDGEGIPSHLPTSFVRSALAGIPKNCVLVRTYGPYVSDNTVLTLQEPKQVQWESVGVRRS